MKTPIKLDLKVFNQFSFYIIFGGVCLFCSAIIIFAFPPQVSSFMTTWQNFQQTKKDVAALTDINSALTTQNASSIKPYLDRATFALPDEKKTAGLISGLTNFANNYGVAIQTLEFSPGLISTQSASTGFLSTNETGDVIIPGGVRAVPATLTATGDPTSLKSFLDALQRASQIIGVTLVNYSTPEKGGTGTANISILIYYQPIDTAAIDWKNIKTLTTDDITFLETLSNEDKFTLK